MGQPHGYPGSTASTYTRPARRPTRRPLRVLQCRGLFRAPDKSLPSPL
jgi:hypothetical protein